MIETSGEKPEQSTLNIDGRLTRDQLALWVRERRIDAAMEQAVAPVIIALEEATRLTDRGAVLDGEVKRIFADQERVRENLGKLGQGPDEAALRLRYVQQLEQQEKRLEALRAEMALVEAAEAEARRRIGQLLKDLVIDRLL